MILKGLLFVTVLIVLIIISRNKKKNIESQIAGEKDHEIIKVSSKKTSKLKNSPIFYVILIVIMFIMIFMMVGRS